MIFFRVSSFPSQPHRGACYLRKDGWDDFGFKTAFDLCYCKETGELLKIGSVKIMSNASDASHTTDFGEGQFDHLPENFCSLGQGQGYYEELVGLDANIREEILVGLRDCANDLTIFEKFREEKAFQTSLLRGTQENEVTILYKSILVGNAVPTEYRFSYQISDQPGASIDVSVKPETNPPTNIHVLIGRNGVGKTRLLSGMCDALAGITDETGYGLAGEMRFAPQLNQWGLPSDDEVNFANVVTVAFSAFDGFTPLSNDRIRGDVRYAYVGLRREDTPDVLKNSTDLQNDFASSLKICLDGVRRSRWIKAVNTLHTDPVFADYQFPVYVETNSSIDYIVESFSKLSSVHRIIMLSITRLVQLVDERTLVLIDEPENHLHPPLLSAFVRALSELVISRNGVALIATHSPVVLQEVPRS
ncbi:MAG: AAA family ATPase [Roseobacter sp.]